MPPPRSLNFVFLTHILASGGSNNTSCQVGGVFVAYRQPSVVGGLLISGLLVIPCISAGTLAISVGSKVILSGSLVVKSSFEQVHLWFSFVPVDWARFDHGPCVISTHLSLPPLPWWQYIRYVVILWLLHQSHPTMPRIEQCLHPEFLFVPEYDKVISDVLPSFSQSW